MQNDSLQQQLEDMWKADFRDTNLQDVPQMSKEDRYALDLMEGCVQFSDGHYEIPPLWRPDAPCLPQNGEFALSRLTLLKRRLQRDDVFREGYVNAVQSYIEKGYCRQIPTDVSTNTTWYLPHHAVINPRKPGKVRVVFDCAAKWQGVFSMTCCYMVLTLQTNLLAC